MSYASIEEIERAIATEADARVVSHLRAVAASFERPLPLVRTVDEFACEPCVSYEEVERSVTCSMLSSLNCHNGQRKLTLSLLEFIASAVSQLRCELRDVCIVYAGASGMASVVAASVFPDIQILLYDPDPNTTALMPPFADKVVYRHVAPSYDLDHHRLVVFTSAAGWFDDNVARALRASIKRPRLLFVSDVRVKADEGLIVQDMINQQRWAGILRCDAFMLKFRLPYAWSTSVADAYKRAHQLAVGNSGRGGGKAIAHPPGARVFPYLAGRMYIQLYGRPRTCELRLVGFAKKEGALTYKLYDIAEIESKMAVFNALYRSHASWSFGASATHLRGRAQGYEAVSQYAILTRCARVLTGPGRAKADALRQQIDALLGTYISKDEWTCGFQTALQQLQNPRARDSARRETMEYIGRCLARALARNPSALPPALVERVRSMLAGVPPKKVGA